MKLLIALFIFASISFYFGGAFASSLECSQVFVSSEFQEVKAQVANQLQNEASEKTTLRGVVASRPFQNALFVLSIFNTISSPIPFIYLPAYNLRLNPEEVDYVLNYGIDSPQAHKLIDSKTPIVKKLDFYNKARKVYLYVMAAALTYYSAHGDWKHWEQNNSEAERNGATVVQQITQATESIPQVHLHSREDFLYQETLKLYVERKGHLPSQDDLQTIYERIYGSEFKS